MRYLVSLAFAAVFAALPAHAEEADSALAWSKPLIVAGNNTLAHVLIAISGRPNSDQTESLMCGVTSIIREADDFRLVRCDGEQLVIPRSTHMGDRMFSCMDKIETEARAKVGNDLADYVHNLDTLTVDGDNIEVHHTGKEDFNIDLPTNQPWLPVRLKGLRLKNIHLVLIDGNGTTCHKIKKLDGIAAVVHTAGIDINVEPREFWRYHDKEGNTRVVLGIANPVPAPVRGFLHLPEVVRVHYTFKKNHDKAEVSSSTPTTH